MSDRIQVLDHGDTRIGVIIPSTLLEDGPQPEFPDELPYLPYIPAKTKSSAIPYHRHEILQDQGNDEDEMFSAKKLKSMLKENLSKSHSIHTIKAKLRKEFINEITKSSEKQGNRNEDFEKSVPLTLDKRMLLSLLYAFFQHHHFYHTISVFLAESGLEGSTATGVIAEHDISQMLLRHGALPSKLGQLLKQRYPVLDSTNSKRLKRKPIGKKGDESEVEDSSDIDASLLDVFLNFYLHPAAHPEIRREIAVQTVEAQAGGASIREVLSKQLDDLYSSAQLKHEQLTQHSTQSIEEKFLHYQQECQLRYQQEYELSLKLYQEKDRQRIIVEEQEKAHQSLENFRKQMEFDYQQRFQRFLEREKALQHLSTEQERKYQQSLYESRQLFQQELQAIKHQESSLKRKYELEKEGLQLLELHLKQLENKLQAKEKDLELQERRYHFQVTELRDSIRKELQHELNVDYRSFQEERSKWIQERKKFYEEQLQWKEKVEQYQVLNESLQETKRLLSEAEDAILQLEHDNRLLLSKQQLEEKTIIEMVRNVSPDLLSFSGVSRVMELIKINNELKATLESYQDSKFVKEQFEISQQQIAELKSKLNEQIQAQSAERNDLVKERDKLREENLHLQAKAKAYEYQLLELRQLLSDKEKNVRLLERERLGQQARNSRLSSPHFENGMYSSTHYPRERTRSNIYTEYVPSSSERVLAEQQPTAVGKHVSFAPLNVDATYSASGNLSEESKYRLEEYEKLRERREQYVAKEESEHRRRQEQHYQQQLSALEAEKKRLQDREVLFEKEKHLEVLRLQQEYQLAQLEKERQMLFQVQQQQQQHFRSAEMPIFSFHNVSHQLPVQTTSNFSATPLILFSTESGNQLSTLHADETKADGHSSNTLSEIVRIEEQGIEKTEEIPEPFPTEEFERNFKIKLESERHGTAEHTMFSELENSHRKEEEEEKEEKTKQPQQDESEKLERERREALEELIRERQRIKDREREKLQQRQTVQEQERDREKRIEEEHLAVLEKQKRNDENLVKQKEKGDAMSAKETERQKELEEIEAAKARVLARRATQRRSFQLLAEQKQVEPKDRSGTDSDEEERLSAPVAVNSPIPFQPTVKVNTANFKAAVSSPVTKSLLIRSSSQSSRPRFDFSDDESEDKIEVADDDESGLGGKW